MEIRGIEAVIFDMDGTLVDSEVLTERAIDALLDEHRISRADLDHSLFHGVTWEQTGAHLIDLFPALAGMDLAPALQERFHTMFIETLPPPIPGAREALVAAGGAFPTAIVSSSNRETVEHLVNHLALHTVCDLIVCAEDCDRSKPDPQCFLLAAARLEREPGRCLVFEDSLAGLQAAKRAGMWTVAITKHKEAGALRAVCAIADHAVDDYTELALGFFGDVAQSARG